MPVIGETLTAPAAARPMFSGLFPAYATRKRFDAPMFVMYLALHLSLLAAPFTFTWQALAVAGVVSFCTMCLGITLCYHRLLAHRSFKIPRPLMWFFALLGCLSLQRGPLWWSACHRLHHSQVDKANDPHSPTVSFLWSHVMWVFFTHPKLDDTPDQTPRLAPDLYADPGLRFLEKYYTAINIAFLMALTAAGYFWGGGPMALSFLVWPGLLRIIYGLNITWLVNSAAHVWGTRPFATPDRSRNNWWVALLTWGEGWHNNHHAHPRSAKMGFTWRQPDVTYAVLKTLQCLGLATHVVKPKLS
jgi:fatty-acid desaturase